MSSTIDLKEYFKKWWINLRTERKPHTCPVCGGKGKVAGIYYEPITTGSPIKATCRSCGGTGIVWS